MTSGQDEQPQPQGGEERQVGHQRASAAVRRSRRRAEKRAERDNPVVVGLDSEMVGTRAGDVAGDVGAALGRALREPVADACVARVDDAAGAALGVDERQVADVGERELAAVEHLDGDHVVPGRERTQLALPAVGDEEVGDDHHHAAPAGEAAGLAQPLGEVAAIGFGAPERGQHGRGLDAAAARGEPRGRLGREQRADPVAAAGGEQCERAGEVTGEFALVDAARSEREARRRVDDEHATPARGPRSCRGRAVRSCAR